jgi:hypothetical protein
MDNIYTILPTNNRRARIIAFIIAFILYLLIAAVLLLELKPFIEKKYNEYFPPQVSGNVSPIPALTPPRTVPAPIKYMSQPPSKQQTIAPPAPQAQAPAPAKSPKKSQPTAEKELPKIPERIIQKPQAPQITQPEIPQPQKAQDDDHKEDSDAPANNMPRRRLREKFYKNGRMPQQTVALNQQTQRYPCAAAQLAQGFSNHMQEQQAYEEATALSNTQNTSGHESALETQLFMHKFCTTFCTHSYNNQLSIHTSLIQPHRIELVLSCNKQRKVTRVRFTKTSYDQQINDYIKELLTTMLTPQIPASVVTDEITFPITIELERVYQENTIYFVPGSSGSKRKGY